MTVAAPATPGAVVAKTLRVVIADNDAAVLELLSTDLRLEGHSVVASVLSGADAVTACRQLRPDVLIADYRMPPGINGLETIRQVRVEETARTCILYTNYRSARIASDARRMGAIYVAKGPLRLLRAALPTD